MIGDMDWSASRDSHLCERADAHSEQAIASVVLMVLDGAKALLWRLCTWKSGTRCTFLPLSRAVRGRHGKSLRLEEGVAHG